MVGDADCTRVVRVEPLWGCDGYLEGRTEDGYVYHLPREKLYRALVQESALNGDDGELEGLDLAL